MQVMSSEISRLRRAAGVAVPGVLALLLLSGCSDNMDWDLRSNDSATSGAVERATTNRPAPDSNGVISYPTYQVIVARRGDTVASVATRVGLSPEQLAKYNALQATDNLRSGEVLALPVRVAGPNTATTATPSGTLDVASIATSAIDRVETQTLPAAAVPSTQSSGPAPVRYQVKRGETAFTIARQFNISAKALADWNGLGPDLAVREGQYLIIPTAQDAARLPTATSADATPPGQGSPLPEPPSASQPLPDEPTMTAAQAAQEQPASPNLAAQRTASSAAQFAMPVDGNIISGYKKKVNDGIDISAAAGAAVHAAAAGTVAAVTHDTSGNLILVIKHSGGLLTVYTGIDKIKVTQGAAVTRGQSIAVVATGSPAHVHFEIRQGLESVDPMPYLQ
ncbi:MAG: LysM peptidoglycan-binding domain-containing protein [bacterium]